MDFFTTLAQQYHLTDSNQDAAGQPASEVLDNLIAASPFQDIIGDDKFLTEMVNTAYAYKDEATAAANQSILGVVNPMKYPITFIKPKYTYSPNSNESIFFNNTDHPMKMYELNHLDGFDTDIYVPINQRVQGETPTDGVMVFSFKGTDTLLQSITSLGVMTDYTLSSQTDNPTINMSSKNLFDSHVNNVISELGKYFLDPIFAAYKKICVGHSLGGLVALHVYYHFYNIYPEQFRGHSSPYQPASHTKYKYLACYMVNPLYLFDDTMASIEVECRSDIEMKLSIHSNIIRGDYISSPYLSNGVGVVNAFQPTSQLNTYLYTQSEWVNTFGQLQKVWDYIHANTNHGLGNFLSFGYKTVPLLLNTIESNSPLLRQPTDDLENNHYLSNNRIAYESSTVAGSYLKLETNSNFIVTQPSMSVMVTTNLGVTQRVIADYNFCLMEPTDVDDYSINWYNIYSLEDWSFYNAAGIYRVKPEPTPEFITANHLVAGEIDDVKYFSRPYEIVNIKDPSNPQNNYIFLMRKQYQFSVNDDEFFIGSVDLNNQRTHYRMPTGTPIAGGGVSFSNGTTNVSTNAQNSEYMDKFLATNQTMLLHTEQKRTWKLLPPLDIDHGQLASDNGLGLRRHLNVIVPAVPTATELTHQLFQNKLSGADTVYEFQVFSYANPTFYVQQKALTASTIGDYKHFLAIDESHASLPDTYPIDIWQFTFNSLTHKFIIANIDTSITYTTLDSQFVYLGRLKQDNGLYNQPATAPNNWYQDNTLSYSDDFEVEFVSNTANDDYIFKISQSGSSLKAIDSTWPTLLKSMIFDTSPTTNSLIGNEEFYFILKNPDGTSIDWHGGSAIS